MMITKLADSIVSASYASDYVYAIKISDVVSTAVQTT